jgi:hypothetical protein
MTTIEEIKKAFTEAIENLMKKPVVKLEKAANEMERKAVFVVLAPNEVDEHQDIYSKEEVEKAMRNFNAHCMKANLFHMVETQEAEIIQSYTSPVDMYIGDRFITKGTWLQEWYFPETEVGEILWQAVLNEEITGISIGALATTEDI